MCRESYRRFFEMKSLYLLVLILHPVITSGLELAVGTSRGLVILKDSGNNFTEQRLGNYALYDVSILSLAVDTINGRIFFTRSLPVNGVMVQVIQLGAEQEDDPTIQTVIQKAQGPQYIRAMVYDEGREALYWTDSVKHEISMISIKEAFAGQNATVVHSFDEKKHPAGISIDICHGLLFWTNSNHQDPSVERSNLDGSNPFIIASDNLFMPMTVAVDPMGDGRVFWADKMEGNDYKIEMSHLDGHGRVTLLKGYQQRPFSMSYVPSDGHSVHMDTLLWSDIINDAIYQIEVPNNNGKETKIEVKEIHDFKYVTTMGLFAKTSLNAGYHATCGETSVIRAANVTATTLAPIQEETLSTGAVISEEHGKMEELSTSKEHKTWMEDLEEVTTSVVVDRTEPINFPPLDLTPMAGPSKNGSSSVNSVRLQLSHDYCINGELMKDGNGGPVGCKCFPGFLGPRCEKSLCDNYCVHGSCRLEQGSHGQWEPKCACRLGFVGRRCERDPCWKYCLNGGHCRVESNGQPKCSCLGNGQLARGERCERFPNLLEKVCTLLCSQDSSKTSFIPLEGKDDDAGDAEGPLCVCPSGNNKYVYSTMKGGVNVTGEWPSAENAPGVSPVILALAGVCIILLVLSIYLTFKVMKLRRLPRIKKRIIVSKGSVPLAAGCGGSRGKSPSAGSPVLGEQQQCEITIENCCNMNICETPCFEPQLRSPGKSGSSKAMTTKEEKKVLLVNMEEPKTSCGPCPGADELY